MMEKGEIDVLVSAENNTLDTRGFLSIWWKIFFFVCLAVFSLTDKLWGIGLVVFLVLLIADEVGTRTKGYLNGLQLQGAFRQQKEKHDRELDEKFEQMQNKIDRLSERVKELEGEYYI